MGRSGTKPTVRILMLGAAGVGKNCLESRFTTTTYPPLYDPSLTLSSRRYLTLSPRPSSPPEPTTRPLDTSHGGPPPLRQTSLDAHFLAADEDAAIDGETQDRSRPRTASSTFSNPASLPRLRSTTAEAADAAHAISADEEKEEDRPPVPSGPEQQQHPEQNAACAECRREATTFLVELTSSYPGHLGLDNNSAGGRGYDAVLLVYDVGSRASFDAVSGLLPLCCDRRSRGRRGKGRVMLRGRASVDEGLNEGKHSSGRTKLKRRGSSGSVAFGTDGMAYDRASSSASFRSHVGVPNGNRGPVVALVGNKADFDADYASVDLGLEAKRAALEEVDVGERGLVHPLYRESRLYGGGDADGGVAIGLPELRSMIAAKPRLTKRDTAASSIRPLLSPYSARSFAWEAEVQEERRPGAAEVDEWPLTRKMVCAAEDSGPKQPDTRQQQRIPPFDADTLATRAHTTRGNANLDSVIRRSAVSADHHLSLSNTNNRASILSKRSVRTMQEGSKPLVLTKLPKSEAVENWIRTGSPTTAEHPDDDESRSATDDDGAPGPPKTDDRNRGRSYSTTTTTAAPPRRQVSRLEGEMLARTLLAGGDGGVPFYETSAKTGEGVEEMFEAVVRAVLRQRGVALPDEMAISAACRRKKHVDRKTAVGRRGRKRSEDGPGVELPGASVGDKEKIPVDAEPQGEELDASEDASVPPQIVHRRRRESMLDRFRKVFTKRAAVLSDDAAE